MPAPSNRQEGFTLVELLAAMAVATLLMALLMTLLDSAFRLWQGTEARIEASREARAALGMMAADLQNAVIPPFLPGTSGFLLNSATLPSAAQTDTNIAGSLFFLRSLSANGQGGEARGDLCQVGYFLAYGSVSANAKAGWHLYRYFRNSEATLHVIGQAGLFSFADSGLGGGELLASHVTGLRLTAYSTNAAGTLVPYLPAAGLRPALLTISLTVLDRKTASRFETRSEWLEAESPLLQASRQTFEAHLSLPP